MIDKRHIGKRILLEDGTEETLLGFFESSQLFFGETHRWTKDGDEVTTRDPGKTFLCGKDAVSYRVVIGGYSPVGGNSTYADLTISDKVTAALLVRDYNRRVKDIKPEGGGSFLLAQGPTPSLIPDDPARVWDDAFAREIIATPDLVMDRDWARKRAEAGRAAEARPGM